MGFLFSSAVLGYALAGCGDPPAAMPAPSTGSIRILAMDTASIRSIYFKLDDVEYGKRPNPYVLDGVVVGLHKLFVYDETSAGVSTMVEVLRNRQSDATVWLLSEGPYVGNMAPNFTAQTITGDTIGLQRLRGKVVLLAFFEHT
ncbi:MAG: hypothetical protein FJ217_14690 [Ignavibacteria bacterium]|nr:hypothetical protein [Ignavibacteria bacterium]